MNKHSDSAIIEVPEELFLAMFDHVGMRPYMEVYQIMQDAAAVMHARQAQDTKILVQE